MDTNSMIKFSIVPPNMVQVIEKQIAPLIQKVVMVSHGDIGVIETVDDLISGGTSLIIVTDGAEILAVITYRVRVFETGLRVLELPIVGGVRMADWLTPFMEFILSIAKQLECTELRGYAVRDGWMRVLENYDWSPVHTTLKCEVK